VTAEFEEMIREFNINLAVMRPLYESILDQVHFTCPVKVTTGKSNVDGIGIFTKCAVKRGDTIAPVRESGRRTPAGRYTNHSNNPNAEMVTHEGNIFLVACQDIAEAMEVFVDYRQVWLTVRR
jgi:SET domain